MPRWWSFRWGALEDMVEYSANPALLASIVGTPWKLYVSSIFSNCACAFTLHAVHVCVCMHTRMFISAASLGFMACACDIFRQVRVNAPVLDAEEGAKIAAILFGHQPCKASGGWSHVMNWNQSPKILHSGTVPLHQRDAHLCPSCKCSSGKISWAKLRWQRSNALKTFSKTGSFIWFLWYQGNV